VLNTSLPGTIWESWVEADGEDGGGSDNHIFKAGGVSTYLHEGALGLAFAMRAPAVPADPACAADEAALGLGAFSLAARFGMRCAEVRAARAVAALPEGRSLAALRAAAAEALLEGASRLPALAPRFGFSVDPHAARLLRHASGWRATPAGNASFEWALSGGESAAAPPLLTVLVVLPGGVAPG
jgi:hypothetical protein